MDVILPATKCVTGRAYFPVCLRSTESCAQAGVRQCSNLFAELRAKQRRAGARTFLSARSLHAPGRTRMSALLLRSLPSFGRRLILQTVALVAALGRFAGGVDGVGAAGRANGELFLGEIGLQ